MFTIKLGMFYLVHYDEDTKEGVFSTGKGSALVFNNLDELNEYADMYNLSGYSSCLLE